MWMLWNAAAVAAVPCTLHRVAPADPFALASTSEIPRGSLVRAVPERSCETGVAVDVLAVDPVYAAVDPARSGCIDPADLAPVEGWSWVVARPWDAEPSGAPAPTEVWGPLPATVDCAASEIAVDGHTLTADRVAWLRPADARTLREARSIAEHATRRVGPASLSDVLWTDGGRYSLPWTHWDSAAEVADTLEREALDTEARAERAVRGRGPGDAWLYFKGADPIRSDVWGTPATIHALIDTIADWGPVCAALAPRNPSSCAVQLGDISWYAPKRPDPLGHRDHYDGSCVDIRLFRADASRYEAWWNRSDDRPAFAASSGYDARLTGAFIDLLLARADVDRVLFNDPSVPAATRAKGHDDHLHVCFGGGSGP